MSYYINYPNAAICALCGHYHIHGHCDLAADGCTCDRMFEPQTLE